MSARGPARVPVVMSFGGEKGLPESWGRLERLDATSASLSALCDLRRDQRLLLSFEVNGERFDQARARVLHVERDDDGYCLADLEFSDQLDRRRLAKILADLLSRS